MTTAALVGGPPDACPDLWLEDLGPWHLERVSAGDPRAGEALPFQAVMLRLREKQRGPILARTLRQIVATGSSADALVALARDALEQIDAPAAPAGERAR